MQTDNPFAPAEFPQQPLSARGGRLRNAGRMWVARWWLTTWLSTAVAGAAYGVGTGLMLGEWKISILMAFVGFVFALCAGFVCSSIGLVPLLLLRALLPGRWFPLLLSIASGGTPGLLCADWTAGCTGAIVAGAGLWLFGKLPSSESFS